LFLATLIFRPELPLASKSTPFLPLPACCQRSLSLSSIVLGIAYLATSCSDDACLVYLLRSSSFFFPNRGLDRLNHPRRKYASLMLLPFLFMRTRDLTCNSADSVCPENDVGSCCVMPFSIVTQGLPGEDITSSSLSKHDLRIHTGNRFRLHGPSFSH